MSLISHMNFCKAAAILAAAMVALPATAPAREFRAADTQSEDYPTVQALLHMARLVEERTGGRHRIRAQLLGRGRVGSDTQVGFDPPANHAKARA